MATDYCTIGEVRDFGKFKATETTHDELLEDLIDRVSALFDLDCGRVIVPSADTTHYFTEDDIADCEMDGGIKPGDLILHDTLVSITSLTNGDGTSISGSNYFLLPRSYERKSYIRIKDASTVNWDFTTDGYITVVGKFGYTATVPDDVRQAAIETVLFNFHRAGDALKVTDKPQVSMDGTRYMPIVWTAFAKEVLKHYRRKV